MAEKGAPKTRDWNFATRDKGRSVAGTALFVALRAGDVFLQYKLLTSPAIPSIIHYLGGRTISPIQHNSSTSSILGLGLGLTPYHGAVLLLSAGAAAKQSLWQTLCSREIMYPSFALVVAGYNTFLNAVNGVLSLWASSSQAPAVHGATPFGEAPSLALSQTPVFPVAFYAGLGLYSVGLVVEFVAEAQRAVWKRKPENQGKAYGEGLFSLATNINYGAYVLWRSGFALACGGWAAGAVAASFFTWDFVNRAVPSMNDYCEHKYGDDWRRVRERVKWRLLPFIY